MSTSLSPTSAGSGGQDKSPLSNLNLGFLKNLTEKKTAKDGQEPKRRGPKPDSKPALTRRQELNRQAQRTHRERKELYIKALEEEVLHLKEIFSNVSQDKERLADENRQLRALLTQNGLAGPGMSGGSMVDDSMSNPSGYTSSGSVSGGGAPASSYTSAFTPPPVAGQSRGISPLNYAHNQGHNQNQQHSHTAGQQRRNPQVDYEQAGIDFVLTLEKPCMSHLPFVMERGAAPGATEACGHALMATCPPGAFQELTPDRPFGYNNVASTSNNGSSPAVGADGGQQTWELTKADLTTLLHLSSRLDLDGEITPVMAWGMILAHPRLGELTAEDFAKICEDLGSKTRCYGFGAVTEEFEVRDAMENIFSTKSDMSMVY